MTPGGGQEDEDDRQVGDDLVKHLGRWEGRTLNGNCRASGSI